MFKFYNCNPLRKKLPDCVCRAMSLAFRTNYYVMEDILHENGLCYDCDEINIDCYNKLLEDMGLTSISCNGKTVDDICKEYPEDIVLVRLEGHMTCCVNGNCYDIWDCTKEEVDRYWVID